MKTKLTTFVVGMAISTSCACAQSVLTEDFLNYTSSGVSSVAAETFEGNILHSLGSLANWSHTGNVGVAQIEPTKAALFLAGGDPTGTNSISRKISIPSTGLYNISFYSLTVANRGDIAGGDVFIKEAGWSETFIEVSDNTPSFRSYQTKLAAGEYTFGLQNNANSKNHKDMFIAALNVTAVPEPSSSALLGLGALSLLIRRKR